MRLHRFVLFLPVLLGSLLVVSSFSPHAHAVTSRYVDRGTGNDAANHCSNNLTPCKTLTHAIIQSSAGHTINAAGGTYCVAGNGKTRGQQKWQYRLALENDKRDPNRRIQCLSSGRAGRMEKINAQFRQANHVGAALGDKYRYIDRQANTDKTHRYKIEIIYLEWHIGWTNVIRVGTL